MRMLLRWTAGSIVGLLLGAPAHSAQVPFTGTLSIQIGALPAIPIEASGVAEVSLDTGGAIVALTIPSGAFATALTVPVPNAFPILQIRLAGPGGVGALGNGSIAVSGGGTCTAGHPNVVCPGGGLAGFGGLSGSAIIGLLSTHTAGSGTGPAAELSVPLGVVGGGSTAMASAEGVGVTVSGAGWTTGTVSIVNPLGTFTVHLAGSGTGVGTTTTTFVTAGSRMTNPGSVEISLVSPVQVFNTGTDEFSSSVARLSLRLVPEPSGPVLVFSALAGVAALYGARRLRR